MGVGHRGIIAPKQPNGPALWWSGREPAVELDKLVGGLGDGHLLRFYGGNGNGGLEGEAGNEHPGWGGGDGRPGGSRRCRVRRRPPLGNRIRVLPIRGPAGRAGFSTGAGQMFGALPVNQNETQ